MKSEKDDKEGKKQFAMVFMVMLMVAIAFFVVNYLRCYMNKRRMQRLRNESYQEV